MKIGVPNRLWRQAGVGLRLASCCFSPAFKLGPVPNSTFFERSMGIDIRQNCSTYNKNADYSNEMSIPGLQYETRVMSFGDGSSGALGHHTEGYFSDVFTPETVEGLPTNIIRVAAGHYHSLAVTEDGEVWAWGRNTNGQLGPRDGKSREEWGIPQRVKGLESAHVKDVVGSGVISMALSQDGSLWAWGSSKRGQLGLAPDVTQSEAPQQVGALADQHVSQVALGWGHALACTTEGKLYAWGYPADGRLGFELKLQPVGKGDTLGKRDAIEMSRSEAEDAADMQAWEMMQKQENIVPVWEPTQVEILADQRMTNVACGMDHSLALAENGDLYSFGDNSLGQLGRPTTKDVVGAVKFPDGKNKVISFAAGLGHSLAICFDPHEGGDSVAAPPHLPAKLTKPLTIWETDIKEAVQGSLFSWGWNSGSQLGRAGDPNLPGLVEGLAEEKLVRPVAGRVHSAGLSSKRQVWTWGSGRNGRLGLGSSMDQPCPFPIEGLGFWKVLQVACGFDHSLVLVRTVRGSLCTGSMG